MEFTSWFSGDFYYTLVGLANMSSSMASGIIAILFAFVIFLLLFRAFTSFLNRKHSTAALNILYVFILGFLFLGAGRFYLNYVNITGFTEDDSKNLDSNAPSDSTKVNVEDTNSIRIINKHPGAAAIGGVIGGVVSGPIGAGIGTAIGTLLTSKIEYGEVNNTVRYKIDNIPYVYVIPAFMDEVAVSLAKAAGLDRSGDYYTLAITRNPNAIFDMATNLLINNHLRNNNGFNALCALSQRMAACFNRKEQDMIITTCMDHFKISPDSFFGLKQVLDDAGNWVQMTDDQVCSQLAREYGTYMQQALDSTLGKYGDNPVYKAWYQSYSAIAQELKNGNFNSLPVAVKSKMEASLFSARDSYKSIISQMQDARGTASDSIDPNVISAAVQWAGIGYKGVMASLGKEWLVMTMLIQNQIAVFLSFFLLPLVVLVTFLVNNFKYLTEYAFGYLLLKLQLPLWVIGHYFATGHVLNNLLTDPSMNAFLIALSKTGISDSDILVNTVTAGVTAMGVGGIFLFAKSAAGGVNQGVAAGKEILSSAIEAVKITAATAGAVFGGAAGLAGAGAGAVGAAGSAAGGASSITGAVGSALTKIAGSNSVAGLITNTAEGVRGIANAVKANKLASMPQKVLDVFTNKELGTFMTDESTGELEGFHLKNHGAAEDVVNRFEEHGYKVKRQQVGDKQVMIVRNKEGSATFVTEDGLRWKRVSQESQKGDKNEKEIAIDGSIFKPREPRGPGGGE